MQVAYLCLALQMPVGWRSCRQNDEVAGSKVSLTSSEPFLNGRGRTEIDDEGMARKSRQGKIIERVDDLRDIKPTPAFSAARLHNMFERNIEHRFVVAFLERSLLHPGLPSCCQTDAADTDVVLHRRSANAFLRFYHRTSSSQKNCPRDTNRRSSPATPSVVHQMLSAAFLGLSVLNLVGGPNRPLQALLGRRAAFPVALADRRAAQLKLGAQNPEGDREDIARFH